LRNNKLSIASIETGSAIKDFDLLGFSLGSELDYTNVLNILDLGFIPLEANLRDCTFPLVIGGGPCALNPEPIHEFFDIFLIGEAEDAIARIVEIYRQYQDKFKSSKMDKQELLRIFARLPGIYVPSLYEVTYKDDGSIKQFAPKDENIPVKIEKQFVKNLNSAPFPVAWLIPYIQVIHDRITLEIMRGCPNRCRFCQARSQYYPFRIRDEKNVLNLAQESYKCTGYEEISLAGLSVSDYPKILELMKGLLEFFKSKSVGISLPSLKARALLGELSTLIASVRKTGLTFAPEAGTERLRSIIAKDFLEDEFFAALKQAYQSGYQHVKLYFMIGLPFEDEADIKGILDFTRRTSEAKRGVAGGPAQVNISINTFIPKPHTPFQWCKMDDCDTTKAKHDNIKINIRNKRVKISFHNRNMSFLEGILSRGDRKLSKVLLSAYKQGARFDAWGNHFNFQVWLDAFKEAGVDPDNYIKERAADEILPWDFIDVGISKESLLSEFNKTIDIK